MQFRRFVLLAFTLAAAACVKADRRYGETAPYRTGYSDWIQVTIPENAPSITQQYRRAFAPIPSGWRDHLGIDIHAELGRPVLAAAPGIVRRSFSDVKFGNQVEIEHIGPDNQIYLTKYWHLADRGVAEGDQVRRGDVLGGLGRSGAFAAGLLHLHFELRVRNTKNGHMDPLDPHLFWKNGKGQITCYQSGLNEPAGSFVLTYPAACK